MRKHPTGAEALLWNCLRRKQLGLGFRRQVPMLGYIVDFYAPSIGLIVEVDGTIHDQLADTERDKAFARQGLTTLRLWNDEVVKALPSVIEKIKAKVRELRTHNSLENLS